MVTPQLWKDGEGKRGTTASGKSQKLVAKCGKVHILGFLHFPVGRTELEANPATLLALPITGMLQGFF